MRNTVAAFVVIAMFLAAGGMAFAHGGKHETIKKMLTYGAIL